jgi:uncharacterized protein
MPGIACSTRSLTSTVASSRNHRSAGAHAIAARGLVIAIHDVAPPLEGNVRALWAMCRSRGVTPALLVVPNWHGQAPLGRASPFVAWVRGCADAGADILLHGDRHDEQGLVRGWRDELRGWGRTRREGEFLTLDEPAARERIARGLDVVRRVGLDPVGFVPPAWLARPGCWRAVSTCGLRVSEDAHAVQIHGGAGIARIASPVVRWSARTSARAMGSAVVAAARWRVQHRAACIRIALHPGDVVHPRTARSIAAALDRWLTDRPTLSYAALAAAEGA